MSFGGKWDGRMDARKQRTLLCVVAIDWSIDDTPRAVDTMC